MNSTSFHRLESDRGLSKSKKLLWLLLNFINNNWYPNKNAKLLNIKSFCPELNENDWEQIHLRASPARSYSDLFWLKLDWQAIKSEIGDICVFDTGCGPGGYSVKLKGFSKCLTRYCGVDIKPHQDWDDIARKNKSIRFKRQISNDILDSIPQDTNFFITQAAIEHFKNDLLYFEQLKKFVDASKKNTIQIHLCPASVCLKLYLWHGVRQYTIRTISKITNVFNSQKSYSMLFKLGGSNCSKLHFQYITKPTRFQKQKDLRDTKNEEYRRLLKEAVGQDIKLGTSKTPILYALIIHSNYKNEIFENMENLTKLSI